MHELLVHLDVFVSVTEAARRRCMRVLCVVHATAKYIAGIDHLINSFVVPDLSNSVAN